MPQPPCLSQEPPREAAAFNFSGRMRHGCRSRVERTCLVFFLKGQAMRAHCPAGGAGFVAGGGDAIVADTSSPAIACQAGGALRE